MNDAMASRWVVAAVLASACAPGAGNPPKTAVIATPTPPPPSAPEVAALPPATPEEKDLAERLKATVTHLASDIGERNLGRSWNLASATDDLARTWEKLGYEVHRQGIVVGDDVAQNLDVRAGGGEHGAESIVVAAHYDTVAGSPGADDNASGAAAVLELGRLFRDRKTSRTVRFALLANGEAPHFGTEQMGSLVYAKALVAAGEHVVGMMSVDGIGVYRAAPTAPGTAAAAAVPGLPATSDFVAILGNEPSRAFVESVALSMSSGATLSVASAVLAADAPAIPRAEAWDASDQWAFWKLGLPAVLVTDTGAARYAHEHDESDVPSELDFDRMARVVAALERTIAGLAAL